MSGPIETAAAAFFEQRHQLLAFIQGLVRDPHASEDIFQEVWLCLARELDAGCPPLDAAKWCRGVARNLILHHWRSQRTSPVRVDSDLVDFLEQVEAAFAAPATPLSVWSERQCALQECLTQLPEPSRGLVALKYDEGRSVEEIAARLGQSTHAIAKALFRLRRALAECVERRLRLAPLRP
jgi:RNA polymerase sigma-70 factor